MQQCLEKKDSGLGIFFALFVSFVVVVYRAAYSYANYQA